MTLELFGLWICILWSICIYLRLGRILLRLDQILKEIREQNKP
jgi:hypothetical protein